MRSHRRWLLLAVPAALAALVFVAPAASSPRTAGSHVKVMAAASQANGNVRIVHRGFVKDCEEIQLEGGPDYISGNGVNEPVTTTTTGNCFDLYNKFSVVYSGVTYTGYEYQNGDGHCLWDNGGTIDVGAACQEGHPKEEFFGNYYDYAAPAGWVVSDVQQGPSYIMASLGCTSGSEVAMATSALCFTWNFPQG